LITLFVVAVRATVAGICFYNRLIDVELSDLHYAAGTGDGAKVRELIASGSPVNSFENGSTPLHLAAQNGHLEVVTLLLEMGADVNARDPGTIADTPLGLVAGNCSLELAQLLINAGADPTIRGWMQICGLDAAKKRIRGDGPAIYRSLVSATKHLPPDHRGPKAWWPVVK